MSVVGRGDIVVGGVGIGSIKSSLAYLFICGGQGAGTIPHQAYCPGLLKDAWH